MGTNLRAVDPDERRRPRKLTVTQAAASGDRRALLVALRDEVAVVIQAGCSPRDLGTLSLRLSDITREIETIDAEAAKRAVDDAAEREAREAIDSVFDPASI